MVEKFYFTAGHLLIEVRQENKGWILKQHHTDWDLMCVAVDPIYHERVYVGTFDHGLKISNDGGKTWESAGDGITHKRVMSIAVSPTEVIHNYHVVWVGTEPSCLFRSEDGGITWTTFPGLLNLPSRSTWRFPPRPHTHHIQSIQPDLHDENRLFVGIELGGVMKSIDKGATWEDRKPNSLFDCHHLTMIEQAPNHLYEAAGGGYAFSFDGGKSWETYNDGLGNFTYLYDIAVDSGDPHTIIVSAAESARTAYVPERSKTVLLRREKNKAWEMIKDGLPDPEGSSIFSLLSTKDEPGVFYAVNNTGIYRSEDRGKSWSHLPVDWPAQLQTKRIRGFVAV